MPIIRRYAPAFCDQSGPKEVSFETHAELMAIPFVKNFSAWPNFYRYSKSKSKLIAEYDNGKTWFVVGTLIDIDLVDMPIWVPAE